MKKLAFLFPGQGAQYVGMGRGFYDQFNEARQVFEEADDLLQRHLSKTIFEGPEHALVETKTAQPAIFVVSMAILRVLKNKLDLPSPLCTAGLSLGEYTALTAAGILSFEATLRLVNLRASLMHEACEQTSGGMLVVMGLSDERVQQLVDEINLPNDVWCANFNCPGQVVVSGTQKGLEVAKKAAQAGGAKRVLPLNVHGAFHSGLMKSVETGLERALQETEFSMSSVSVAMNVSGKFAESASSIRSLLFRQVTSSVLWHQCVSTCANACPSQFLEIGCGKTLSGMNKRIGIEIPTLSIETPEDLATLETIITQS